MRKETVAVNPEDWQDTIKLIHYGWGIVDKDALAQFLTQSEQSSWQMTDDRRRYLSIHRPELRPYRTVELFYKELSE